jgi:NAD(P)-dependent dehydrogenase (short-subunit alcohol dehydrogenase family)
MERRVIVTRAGSGIGRETALEAARLGFTVVATVHREDQVDDLARAAAEDGPGLAAVEVLDVTDDDRAADVITRHPPWGLANVAGLLSPGLLADMPPADARRHLDVMALAPVRLAQLALPAMRRQGGGRVVNVSSVLGDVNGPMLGWYQAAKQALSTVSDTQRVEFAHDGVDVVLVEPGPYATPIWGKAREYLRRLAERSPEPEVYERADLVLAALERRGGDPAEAAAVICAALRAGHPRFRYRVGPGRSATVLARAVPTSVRDRVTRAVAGI